MAYKVYLNETDLIIDTAVQSEESISTISASVRISAVESGSFDFTIPSSHKCYNNLHRLKDLVDIYRDDVHLWAGRVYSIVDNKNGTQTVSCEGILSMLADSVFRPITYQGTLYGLVQDLLRNHNEQTEGDKHFFLRNFTIPLQNVYRDYTNYESTISRLQDLLDTFGGYIMVERTYDPSKTSVVDIGIVDQGLVDVGDCRILLDWIEDFTDVCDQKVELASNLVDIKKTIDADSICTVILPIGAKDEDGKRLTIASVNSGSDTLFASTEAIEQYGYIVRTVIWDDVHEASILKTKAQQYLEEALQERTQIKLKAVDLADAGYDIESFRVGQKIVVTSLPHGIDEVEFNCLTQKLDLFRPGNNRLELGEVKKGYIQSQISSAQQAQISLSQDVQWTADSLRSALDIATRLITGNQGGYVVMHSDPNVSEGLPYEILIMDKPDIASAQRLWRMNQAGIGYSKYGYNGPYDLAITMDGRINADFIQTGTLTADLIRAGVLRSLSGESYWNLNTGELHIVGELGIENTLNTVPNQNMGYWITGRLKMSRAYVPLSADNLDYLRLLPALITEFYLRPKVGPERSERKYVLKSQTAHGVTSTWTDPTQHVEYTDLTMCKDRYLRSVAVITDMDYDLDSGEDPESGTQFSERIDTYGGFSFGASTYNDSYYGAYKDRSYMAVGRNRGILFEYVDVFGKTVYLRASGGGLWVKGNANDIGKPDIALEAYSQTINSKQISFDSSSSERYKKNIQKLHSAELDPERLYKLEAKEFQYKEDFERLQYEDMAGQTIPGFIAEEVADVYPSAVIHDIDGNIESWDERRILPGMLSLIQKQHKEIEALKSEIADIRKLLEKAVR